ncbi:glycosyltransferase family 2 protein [uncultured Chryseobacterium sp.]|uniref:glycosyltransferase family 2 protein n=1 Tax=uncultured Chryseobacterium sp. TaxID=259322 RepID=UPI0025E7827F|nr:glycosyltransferase family 2 protein [uncultured Chryseobacterium sp.]
MQKVSVIIPCYNVSRFLNEGLESIINQSYDNLEIICLNDCSTDDTLSILQEFAVEDNRIKIFSNEVNKGLIFTLNKLVSLASCEILIRMDPDDVAEKDRILNLVGKMIEDDADLVSSNYSWIDENSKPLKKKGFDLLTTQLGIKYTAIFNSPFPHPQSSFKKKIFKRGIYDHDYKAAEDYKLWTVLLLSENFKGVIVNKELYRYRINESGMSLSNASLQSQNHITIAKNYTAKLLCISTESFRFWDIAKKMYRIENFKDIDFQLKTVANLRKTFITKFKADKQEVIEIDSYTFQYLIYLYKNIWEMSNEGKVSRKRVFTVLFKSVFRTLELFSLKNIRWIVRNM